MNQDVKQQVRKTAAKLLSLDRFVSQQIDRDDTREISEHVLASLSYASDFVPSVFGRWIDRGLGLSSKQLAKIDDLYETFELEDADEFLNDPRLKGLG